VLIFSDKHCSSFLVSKLARVIPIEQQKSVAKFKGIWKISAIMLLSHFDLFHTKSLEKKYSWPQTDFKVPNGADPKFSNIYFG